MGVERRGGHLVSGSFGQESSSQIVALVNMATRIFLDEKVALGTGFTITQWVGPWQCPGKKIDS